MSKNKCMKKYVGICEVTAEPITLGEAVKMGYVEVEVELTSAEKKQQGYMITYADGYMRYMPKTAFSKEFTEVTAVGDIDSLYVEREFLIKRFQYLVSLTESDKFAEKVPDEDTRVLLKTQCTYMSDYLHVLNKRIQKLVKE